MARRRLARRVRLGAIFPPALYPLAYPLGYPVPVPASPRPEPYLSPQGARYKDLLAWTWIGILVAGGAIAARALLR